MPSTQKELSVSFNQLTEILKEIVKYKRRIRRFSFLGFSFEIIFDKTAKNKLSELSAQKTKILNEILSQVKQRKKILQQIPGQLQKSGAYLIYEDKAALTQKIQTINSELDRLEEKKTELDNEAHRAIEETKGLIPDVETSIETYNEEFVNKRIRDYAPFFKKSGINFDENQLKAIVRDDKHNLVVAGAGSGKTEVLVTRIGYLVERKPDTIKSNRILALAYQNDAEAEMRNRLKKRYNLKDIEIKTFHSLGYQILSENSKITGEPKPRLKFDGNNAENELKWFIQSLFENAKKSPEYQKKVIRFMQKFGDSEKILEETDFEMKVDYYEYLRQLRYTALNGIKVNSEAEREILNYFISHNLNGKPIKAQYEDQANWMAYTGKDGQLHYPKPDFFLPEYGIYIEHWAIGKNGKVPDWFGGENPTEEYLENMKKKQAAFKNQKKYVLIETSQSDCENGILLSKLEKALISAIEKKKPDKTNKLEEAAYDELINRVWSECKESINYLPTNIARYITIAKTYNLTPEKIANRLDTNDWSARQVAFAQLALPIFLDYEKELRKENSIDFQDMINRAIDCLNSNKNLYADAFDHILIDEYQDISTQRYELIKALMQKNPSCKLFCVGDDWQSILGFTGANLDFFTKFQQYFDHPQRTDLPTNYRSIKTIVDAGASVIKNNGSSQLKKTTVSDNDTENKITVYSSLHEKNYKSKYYQQVAEHLVAILKDYLEQGYQPNEIMILCRILSNPKFIRELQDRAKAAGLPISMDSKKDNVIRLMSVHKSKGLQARLVVILNVDSGTYGFPCELENPDIFETAITGSKKNREEEERRLFYVAITRTTEDLVIYTQKSLQSKFIKEIEDYVIINELPY